MLKCGLEGAISIRYYDVIRDVARDFQKVALGHVYCGASYLFVLYVLFMALITTLVLCARSQDIVMSVSVRRVHVEDLLFNGYIG